MLAAGIRTALHFRLASRCDRSRRHVGMVLLMLRGCGPAPGCSMTTRRASAILDLRNRIDAERRSVEGALGANWPAANAQLLEQVDRAAASSLLDLNNQLEVTARRHRQAARPATSRSRATWPNCSAARRTCGQRHRRSDCASSSQQKVVARWQASSRSSPDERRALRGQRWPQLRGGEFGARPRTALTAFPQALPGRAAMPTRHCFWLGNALYGEARLQGSHQHRSVRFRHRLTASIAQARPRPCSRWPTARPR